MIKFLPFALLLLSPAVVPGADLADGEQQSPDRPAAVVPSDPEPDPAPGPGEIVPAELEQIEAFGVGLKGAGDREGPTGDDAIALIVNPFSARKRGKMYGSLYEYHRNDNFDARNFFDPLGEPLPEFKRNQFGFSLGALVTGKLKLFGSYDGLRIIKGSTKLSLVPTPEMKRGDFSGFIGRRLIDPFTGLAFPGNRIPEGRIHPVAAKLLPLFPDPNREDSARNYVNNHPFVNNRDVVSARVDYEFSPRTKIFGNYSIGNGKQRTTAYLPSFATTIQNRVQTVSLDLTHSFSSNKVLNISAYFDRNSNLQLSEQAYQSGLLDSLGIEGLSVSDPVDEGYPVIELLGYASLNFGFGFSGGGSPNVSVQNDYSLQAGYTYVRGKHTVAFSGDLHWRQLNGSRTWGTRRGQFNFSGQFSGDSFADFLLGIPYAALRGIGSDRADLRQRSGQLSVRDDWKINRNWTLSVALAYNHAPFPFSIHDNVSLFYPLLFEPPMDGEIVVAGSPRARELGLDLGRGQAAYNDRNDWEPGLGLAYSPFGDNRLVWRASYRMFHSPMNFRQAQNNIGRNYPFFYLERAESPTRPDIDLSRPFASAAPAEQTIQAMDPHLRNPYIQQWQLSVQYEFQRSWSLELAYEGRKTTRLYRTMPANVPLPAAFGTPIQARRPNPAYGRFDVMTSGSSYSGNELNAQLTRRLTGAFSIQAGFEWNKAISDCWGWAFANPGNPRQTAGERSLWGFQPPMRFNLDYILELPVGRGKLLSTDWAGKLSVLLEGWRISGITTITTGWPFHPEIFGDPNSDGVWGDRPNRIGPGTLSASRRSVDKWFETSDFVIPDYAGPEPQWFGDSGRNILLTPGEHNWDISILKRTRVSKDGNLLEFRFQLFNAFNRANFQQPGSFIGTPTFGVISNAENAREIEIAVKYSF
jgi:hypothetical protein